MYILGDIFTKTFGHADRKPINNVIGHAKLHSVGKKLFRLLNQFGIHLLN
jgi:hypothetical protein